MINQSSYAKCWLYHEVALKKISFNNFKVKSTQNITKQDKDFTNLMSSEPLSQDDERDKYMHYQLREYVNPLGSDTL